MSLSMHFIFFLYNNPHIPFHIKIQKNLYIKKKSVYLHYITNIQLMLQSHENQNTNHHLNAPVGK